MTSLSFVLPLPPSVNALYANAYGKGRVKTKAYLDWEDEAGWSMRISQMSDGKLGANFLKFDRLKLTIEVGGKGDLDNLKAIPDLLKTMSIIKDDKFIEVLHITRAKRDDLKLTIESIE